MPLSGEGYLCAGLGGSAQLSFMKKKRNMQLDEGTVKIKEWQGGSHSLQDMTFYNVDLMETGIFF